MKFNNAGTVSKETKGQPGNPKFLEFIFPACTPQPSGVSYSDPLC